MGSTSQSLCPATNPCGRAHYWLLDDWPQVETTLEPHDCSKMEKEKALADPRWSALQGSRKNDAASDSSDPSKSPRRLSSAGLPPPPLLKSDLLTASAKFKMICYL